MLGKIYQEGGIVGLVKQWEFGQRERQFYWMGEM